MRTPVLTVLALVLLAAPLFLGPATAAVLTVTDCGDTTPGGGPGQLRRLIADAAPGDTINVPACVITLTGVANEDANAGGDLDIAKNLTIQGAGAHATVIVGGGDRIFDVFAPATVTIADLMVRNGEVRAPMGQPSRGGGIRNAGMLTLTRVNVRDNSVSPGQCGDTVVAGGGIANDGTLAVTDTAIEGNLVRGCPGGSGGGVDNAGGLTLTRTTVSGNGVSGLSCCRGADEILNSGTLALVESTVASHGFSTQIVNVGTMTALGSAVVGSPFSIGPLSSSGIISPGSATLTNTIVANSSRQCFGSVVSNGGNLATDDTCNLSGPSDAVVADAGLGPLGTQGGPTSTHPLVPGSPAIDTALQSACSATDQRGQVRPAGSCDKGPFEFTPPVFSDVAVDHFARGAIEALAVHGVTGGCGTTPPVFCPDDPVTRAQMAVFLVRLRYGPGFDPPPATGIFADVPPDHPFAEWIEQLAQDGITGGCATSPPRFCPDDPVSRAQMAVFILRTLSIPGFTPPAAGGTFSDVPPGSLFEPWIEELFNRGITSGCQAEPPAYCPDDPATRAQIAVFLVRAFGLGF
jgi:hypothetical protein